MHVHHMHSSSSARVTVLYLKNSLSLTMNVQQPKSCIIYFPKYRKLDNGNFSLTLTIFKMYLKVIIITDKIFSVTITIT